MVEGFTGGVGIFGAGLLAAALPTMALAAAFVLVMVGAGFLVGRRYGTPGVLSTSPARGSVTDAMRRSAKQVVASMASGETDETLFLLLKDINSQGVVDELFGGAPLDTLLSLVNELPTLSREQRALGDQLLRLLSRIAIHTDDATRMRILGALVKVVPKYRHVVPFLVEICKRNPDAWNDLQPSLEVAIDLDAAVARFLADNAGPKEPFIRAATERYMTSMVRFRRLCEDRAAGSAGSVDAELSAVIDREFRFLRIAGTASRRFVWLPAQAHRFHPLLADEHLDLLLREAPSGLSDVHALLGQLALAWALDGTQSARVRRVVAALEEAGRVHPSAGDALLNIFEGLRPEDANSQKPEREEHRRRAYFALLSAANHNFEVIKLLGSHGIPRDLYKGAVDAY